MWYVVYIKRVYICLIHMLSSVLDCGPLSDPLNGNFLILHFESIVIYTCDTGYVLDGADTRICQANGTWSGTEPSCASKTHNYYDNMVHDQLCFVYV